MPLLTPSLPPVLRLPGFRLYWAGLGLSQVGSRAAVAANMWQVLELTNSTLHVGLVGLFEAVALLVLGPLGGAIADRMDRRRLMQVTQSTMLLTAGGLAALTLSGQVQPWHIYLAVMLNSGASTFDGAARQAIIPGLVPKDRLVDAYALTVGVRELAVLVGPAAAGLLLAAGGPGPVYLLAMAAAAALVLSLALLHVPPVPPTPPGMSVWASIREGYHYVRGRPLIWQLMSLDFSATFFAAYRVLLPALARDVLLVGAQGYGLLLAAPAGGAMLGSAVAYRLRPFRRKGWLILGITMAYALSAVLLARAPIFLAALVATASLGFFDAIATTIRHAVVQVETPDRLRGRVTSLYQMVSRGGPALGQTYMGALASALGGAPAALALSALVPLGYAAWLAATGRTVRDYTT